MNQNEILALAGGATLTALLLALGHWFTFLHGKLSRLRAYTYGTMSIWLGFTLWQLLIDGWWTIVGLSAIMFIGGMTTIAAYRIDGVLLRRRQIKRGQYAKRAAEEAQQRGLMVQDPQRRRGAGDLAND